MEPDKKLQPKKKVAAQRDPPEEIIGPDLRKLKKVDFYDLALENIPLSENYEISYMHRDVVNNIIASVKSEFIITFSVDGHIKFWKKVFHLIEFVKNFKAHNGLITCAALSKNQDTLCSVGIDKTLKIFDILNTDLRMIVRLSFSPLACEFLPRQGFDMPLVAISEEKSGRIMIIDTQTSYSQEANNFKDEENNTLGQKTEREAQVQANQNHRNSENIIKILNLHRHPIKHMKMNWAYNFCVSIDERGFMQVWDPSTFDFPECTKYKCKVDTEFLKMTQQNSIPIAMTISTKGNLVAIYFKDRIIKIFNLITGKCVDTVNESIKEITRVQEDSGHQKHSEQVLEESQFQKKLSIEKEIEMSKEFLTAPQIDFDQSEQFLIYPSFRGIKIYSLERKYVERILGKKEHERFIKVCLYQGKVMRNPAGSSTVTGERKAADPTIFCTSFRRTRFYIFSTRNPEIGPENGLVRDIVNEKTTKEDLNIQSELKLTEKKNVVVLNTTLGDIHLLLFLDECPKTCENFIKLSKKGYYNNLIFHRVIKGFMIQTGCPKGDGTGGESIWGGYFEDELCPQKHRFDRPYMVAMANRGPNTNGSQFFITVVACPWLDNKHTVFGRVTKGIETVCDINKLKTDKTEKPLINVKITSVIVK